MSTLTIESVEYWPPERLIPYTNNARTHSDTQISQIAGSIVEFGFVNPILVGDDGVIVAGHGRLMAAQQLAMEQVPVIVLSHLSSTQRRALIIADNKLAENAGWDDDLLSLELNALDEAGVELALLGFSDDALAELLAMAESENDQDPDTIPEVATTVVSQPGDLWQLGEHRLLCGDATSREDVEQLMANEMADMIFQDSPYNVDYGNNAKDKLRGKDRRIMNDNLGDDFYDFLVASISNTLAFTKGACYLAMSSSELDTLQKAFKAAGGKWSTFIIWAKNHFTMGRADYQRQYEPILYGWPAGHDHYWCGARDQSDVWFIDKPVKNDLHPTMKPVALVERAIGNSSKTHDIVLDAFGGSGTTLIACENLRRRARLLELDPQYVDVIIRRWQTFTGESAYRQRDGLAFDELAGEARASDHQSSTDETALTPETLSS